MDQRDEKKALRREVKARLAEKSAAELTHAGESVADAVMAFIDSRKSAGSVRVVSLFASLPTEIDTRPLDARLRAAGIVRAVPAIVEDKLVLRVLVERAAATGVAQVMPSPLPIHELPAGVLGIPTPGAEFPVIDPIMCHAIVVPGVAFDARGGRLGYGKGFYDHALARVDTKRCVAIALDEQIVDAVPLERHDVRLKWLCTPARGVFAVDDDSARR